MAFAALVPPLSLRLLGELAGATTRQAGLRQRLPGKAGLGWAGPAREGSPLPEFQEGKLLWRPSPRHPREAGETALGSRAGIPRAAGTLQCWRETFQRGTRRCKLNGKFASCSLQKLVPPSFSLHLPQPPNSGDSQD